MSTGTTAVTAHTFRARYVHERACSPEKIRKHGLSSCEVVVRVVHTVRKINLVVVIRTLNVKFN
jgi:hypothetical protein